MGVGGGDGAVLSHGEYSSEGKGPSWRVESLCSFRSSDFPLEVLVGSSRLKAGRTWAAHREPNLFFIDEKPAGK